MTQVSLRQLNKKVKIHRCLFLVAAPTPYPVHQKMTSLTPLLYQVALHLHFKHNQRHRFKTCFRLNFRPLTLSQRSQSNSHLKKGRLEMIQSFLIC
jgi:hypothetical protein